MKKRPGPNKKTVEAMIIIIIIIPQKLALTSPTSGGRSVGIVRSRTKVNNNNNNNNRGTVWSLSLWLSHQYCVVSFPLAFPPRLLVGKPEGKRPLGRPRRRWVDNIRMDLGEAKDRNR
jgi:hypothetical protein